MAVDLFVRVPTIWWRRQGGFTVHDAAIFGTVEDLPRVPRAAVRIQMWSQRSMVFLRNRLPGTALITISLICILSRVTST